MPRFLLNAIHPDRALAPLILGTLCFSIHLLLTFGLLHSYTLSRPSTEASRIEQSRGTDYWHHTFDLNRWDSVNYRQIVLTGYRDAEDPHVVDQVIRWYPGYPIIAKPIIWLTGWKVYAVFSGLSALFTFCFWVLLWTPGMLRVFGRKGLTAVAAIVLCWPGAFFWFSGMTEPLVALLLLVVLRLWLARRLNWLAIVFSFATSVKQIFMPLALAVALLDLLRHRSAPWKVSVRTVVALFGFLAFGTYSWWAFGDFFASSNTMMEAVKYGFVNALNPKLLATSVGTLEGFVAFCSIQFLLFEFLRISREEDDWRHLLWVWRRPAEPSVDFVLWWTACAYTAVHFVASADTVFGSFTSMLRYQTANVPLFLLLARHVRTTSGWSIAIGLTPLLLVSLYWQRYYVVDYWLGIWVS